MSANFLSVGDGSPNYNLKNKSKILKKRHESKRGIAWGERGDQ
jgi:hypothetical protein